MRLTNGPYRGRSGQVLRVGFTTTRRATGVLRLNRNGRVVVHRTVRARAGANSIVLRLPRRSGAYRLALRVSLGMQSATDSATLVVGGS